MRAVVFLDAWMSRTAARSEPITNVAVCLQADSLFVLLAKVNISTGRSVAAAAIAFTAAAPHPVVEKWEKSSFVESDPDLIWEAS